MIKNIFMSLKMCQKMLAIRILVSWSADWFQGERRPVTLQESCWSLCKGCAAVHPMVFLHPPRFLHKTFNTESQEHWEDCCTTTAAVHPMFLGFTVPRVQCSKFFVNIISMVVNGCKDRYSHGSMITEKVTAIRLKGFCFSGTSKIRYIKPGEVEPQEHWTLK